MDKRVEEMITKVRTGELSEKQLDNLYENVSSFSAIGEGDRETLLEEIMLSLRSRFPKVAKRRFGAKDVFARELLTSVFEASMNAFDLAANRVNNKVKTGGDMMAGRAYVDVYVSYKDEANRRISIDVRQETLAHLPMASVNDLVVGSDQVGERIEFPLDRFAEARDLYLEKLASVAARRVT